ncbi:MAG: AbrB/MazE/SpoVT family DNA-binding domain-containing protein [Nanoarchaeota archaeon]
MTQGEAKLKRWGNSFAIVIPVDIIQKEKLREDDHVRFLLLKDSRKVLRETFGMLKGKLKKSGQQLKDELRRELYSD